MDKSVLVIALALTTLILTMGWAYLSKRKAMAELGSDRPLTGNGHTGNGHASGKPVPVRNENR